MTNSTHVQQTPQHEQFQRDMIAGLRSTPKQLPSKYLYDHRGSALFDQICELDEYYLTRTEVSIMESCAADMGQCIGEGVRLIEYGSGSSIKTRILLDHLPSPVAYVPVDISRKYLLEVAAQLQEDFVDIEVMPVVADFTQSFPIPEPAETPTHTAVYFPGSTIGNFEQSAAKSILENIATQCGVGGGLLIGIDLEKDKRTLELAYDDSSGTTADFTLNLLRRIKTELDAEVDLDGFEHHAAYNEELARIEISIRSLRDQSITIDDQYLDVADGELIRTEYSHKYTIERFSEFAAEAGFELRQSWTDARDHFAVLYLVVTDVN